MNNRNIVYKCVGYFKNNFYCAVKTFITLPFTDDILDRLKKEKQRVQNERDVAISNIKKIYENYNNSILK